MTRLVALFCFVGILHAAPLTVKVRVSAGSQIVELPLERYVAAVLAAESGVFRSDEALKAMAVAARTYAVRMRGRHDAEGFDLCDTTHCQRVDLKAVFPRFEAAANATAGELLWYEGKPAFTPYSRDCGGRTEDAGAVWPDLATPYLTHHDDPWCVRQADARWQDSRWKWTADGAQIVRSLRASDLKTPDRLDRISIVSTTESGRASTLLLTGPGNSTRVSASSFRFAIGRVLGWNTIRSDAYTVRSANGGFYFEGRGSGHGAGLCQSGSERMGASGKSYREILAFYYSGTTLSVTGEGIHWQRLSGGAVTLLTVQPANDRIALDTAERLIRALSARTGWASPTGIELRAYPSLDAFRNATGEPGWVAGRSDGRIIHLQPVTLLSNKELLESTLSHELLHVMMDSQAAPGLPVWFREGLTDFLEKTPIRGQARVPAETDLRQRTDQARARAANDDAAAMVASLTRIYGVSVVLGWVRRGLPPEVTNASIRQPQTKSR